MQLTRCCFVFLVQGSLYLVSGRRGSRCLLSGNGDDDPKVFCAGASAEV